MEATYRTLGRHVLSQILKRPNNVDTLERYIFKYTTDEEEYVNVLYEIATEITSESSKTTRLNSTLKTTLQQILSRIFERKTLWNHPSFEDVRKLIEEEDEFTTRPFEVEEGILQCYKCQSKKTFSYQKQTRSADEGATTFAQCVECGNRWRHNN